jgi:hypothetical protein
LFQIFPDIFAIVSVFFGVCGFNVGYDVGSSPSVNSKSHGYVAPGGTLGGITSGELLVFRVGIKPASSISQDQEMARVREELGRELGVESCWKTWGSSWSPYKVVPPSYKLVYNPINYRYITYKP